jgi:hypothetical protein
VVDLIADQSPQRLFIDAIIAKWRHEGCQCTSKHSLLLLGAGRTGGGVRGYSTEQFASIFRQIARKKRRHSGSLSRLFAGELAEKRREMRSVAMSWDTPI